MIKLCDKNRFHAGSINGFHPLHEKPYLSFFDLSRKSGRLPATKPYYLIL
jgi:hypothetical protein